MAVVFVLFVVGFWAASLYIANISVASDFERKAEAAEAAADAAADEAETTGTRAAEAAADSAAKEAAEAAGAEAKYGLWTVLLGGVGGLVTAACWCFVTWLALIMRLFSRVRVTTALSWVVTVVLVGGAVFGSLFTASEFAEESLDKTLAEQTRLFTVVAAVLIAPGLVAFMALRSLATDDSNWKESALCRLRLLVRLRGELRRLLATFGGILTLLVVATGMRRRALIAFDNDMESKLPQEGVLLYGLVFAVMLGLFYMAASSAIDGRAQRLIDCFGALKDPTDADFSSSLQKRNALATVIGAAGSWRSFESTVVIAAPLLAALISRATGG